MNDGMKAATASQRLAEVDMARALAAIAVVALHAIGYALSRDAAGSAASHIDETLILGLRFARQVFMCLSGCALAYTYRNRVINYRTFVGRRAWCVAVPYLVWSAIPEHGAESGGGHAARPPAGGSGDLAAV